MTCVCVCASGFRYQNVARRNLNAAALKENNAMHVIIKYYVLAVSLSYYVYVQCLVYGSVCQRHTERTWRLNDDIDSGLLLPLVVLCEGDRHGGDRSLAGGSVSLLLSLRFSRMLNIALLSKLTFVP